MCCDSAKLEKAQGQDPHVLLRMRCREAEARALNGEVTVTVKYRDGQKTGVAANVSENYK